MTKQTQKTGDSSVNVQAENITIEQKGLTYTEVKDIALDVFRANFYHLVGVAEETVKKRAEEITDKFINELKQRNPNGLKQAEDPDFQYSLFSIQKDYAKTGDQELGNLLVDILVERSKEEQRNILQIVLNESLKVAPKLTKDQLSTLSIIFILKYTKFLKMTSLNSLKVYVETQLAPFVHELTESETCYQHLSFAGCGTISIGSIKVGKIFREHYPGIFNKGFPKEEVENHKFEFESSVQAFVPCLHDNDLLQINAMNEDAIKIGPQFTLVGENDKNKLISLLKDKAMSENEIENYLKTNFNPMDNLLKIWNKTSMKNMSLSSVGIAIGHANARRVTGDNSPLNIWIK